MLFLFHLQKRLILNRQDEFNFWINRRLYEEGFITSTLKKKTPKILSQNAVMYFMHLSIPCGARDFHSIKSDVLLSYFKVICFQVSECKSPTTLLLKVFFIPRKKEKYIQGVLGSHKRCVIRDFEPFYFHSARIN